MVDRYTKIVLAVIALALAVIAGQPFVRPACGERSSRPCYITSNPRDPIYITTGINAIYVTTMPGDPIEVTSLGAPPVQVEIQR